MTKSANLVNSAVGIGGLAGLLSLLSSLHSGNSGSRGEEIVRRSGTESVQQINLDSCSVGKILLKSILGTILKIPAVDLCVETYSYIDSNKVQQEPLPCKTQGL